MLAGRGKELFNKIDSQKRIEIFCDFIKITNQFKDCRIFSSVGFFQNSARFSSFENLVTKIENFLLLKNAYAILICDEGDDVALTQIIRKKYQEKKGLIKSRIIEDPVFKSSNGSYFIQIVDFLAHLSLRTSSPIKGKQWMYDLQKELKNLQKK